MAQAEKETSRAQAWFCTTGLPSDIAIEVCGMTFHLHRFPLMSKSRKLHNLITDQESASSQEQDKDRDDGGDDDDEIHQEQQLQCQISLPVDFPGGSEAFEAAAKFCYGIKIELTSSNVVPLRCAAEFLAMTDDYAPDNLVSRTDLFLSQSVLKSLVDSTRALKSCDWVMPMAESLNIAQRCVDSIALRAASATHLGWPANYDGQATTTRAPMISWNGIQIGARRKVAADAWFEDDLSSLSLPLFSRLVSAMKSSDVSADVIESCLMSYAKRWIPGISRPNRQQQSTTTTTTTTSSTVAASETQQRELLETIIANLPPGKSGRSAPETTRLLFGLLRTANILSASEACRSALERRIGSQLEQATLDDLLIPTYSSCLKETLYDVDCVGRILGYFLLQCMDRSESEGGEDRSQVTMNVVGKLFDAYLSEIASDANLMPDKFHDLAVALPQHARLFGDGLYRAVDVYLKGHPRITEAEREKVSGVIDCRKLTLAACTHAAQNERLPLRAVVQVLFFEQLQLRRAIAGALLSAYPAQAESSPPPPPPPLRRRQDSSSSGGGGGGTWRRTVMENQVLRVEMDSVRTRVGKLERECTRMRKAIQKNMDGVSPSCGDACAPASNNNNNNNNNSTKSSKVWWPSLAKRLGCKFRTQVRDLHEPTVEEVDRSQPMNHRRHHLSDQGKASKPARVAGVGRRRRRRSRSVSE